MKIKLVFDSMVVYTPAEAKKHNVAITPMIINDDGKTYHDNVSITTREFYKKLDENHQMSTSQPNISETIELFTKLLKDYDHLIYVPIPEALSGTYATGVLAAKEVDQKRITVIDTHTGAGAGRVMIERGNEMIKEGKSVEEIVDYFMKASENSRFYIIPNSLDGLKKGGRISNVAASVFGIVKLKIALYLTPKGSIDKFEIARTENKILTKIADTVKKELGGEGLLIYLIHTGDLSLLDNAKAFLKKEFKKAEFQYMPLPPTLGAHAGPKTIAFHFVKKQW